MKTRLWILTVVACFVLGAPRPGRAEDFYIRLGLIHGSGTQEEAPELDPAIAIYPYSSVVRFDPMDRVPAPPPAFPLNEDIARIYNLRTIYGLADTTLRWDQTSAWIPGIFMVERETFRVDLEPKFLPPKRMKLRLLVFRVRNKAGDLERVLDTDLVVSLDDPAVVGFAYGGRPLFLSVEVTRKKPPVPETPGGPAEGPASGKPVAPMPVRTVAPRLPQYAGAERPQGEVVLRVSVDETGRVTDVQVLKSLRPDVDREVVQALRQWAFEPVRDERGTRPATLAMTFRYRGVPWESLPGPEGAAPGEEPEERPAQAYEPASAAPNELERILAASAEYCRRLRAAALDFVCEERISEDVYDYVPTADPNSDMMDLTALKRVAKKNRLVYDYQMVKTTQGIRESRTLLEDNGRKANQPNAPLLTKRFFSYRSLFGPVGLFSAEQRPLFEYRIAGQDKVRDRKAWVIEVSPRAGSSPGLPYGKAWVAQDTYRILRIEVDEESLAGHEKLRASYDLTRMKPLFLTNHYYEVEKNGILFPSRTVFAESFTVISTQRRFQRSRAEISFTGYRFFTVETETSIKD